MKLSFKEKILSFIIVGILIITPFSNTFASEDSVYNFAWLDPDKEVYVLQNRKYRKKHRPYIDFGVGLTTSGAFVDSTHIQGRAGIFLTEELGAEFVYSMHSGKENTTADAVRANAAQAIPFRRIVTSYMGGMLMWSPFYSKINTFNKIIYMDWLFGIGAAQLNADNNREEVNSFGANDNKTSNSHTGLMWNAGMQIYLGKSIHTRIDLTTIHYQAQSAKSNESSDKEWYSNYDLTLSLGYAF